LVEGGAGPGTGRQSGGQKQGGGGELGDQALQGERRSGEGSTISRVPITAAEKA
jgi:hypothetical protein